MACITLPARDTQPRRRRCRCVAVEEGWPQSGVASEFSAVLMELAFDEIDAPVEHVTGVEVPMPHAANIEAAALPTVEDIVRLAKKRCGK
jgi:pyruvate dehydrogenase E1 component beta subunit